MYKNTEQNDSLKENMFKAAIFLSMVCCWIDAFLSESDDVFYNKDGCDMQNPNNLTKAEEATRYTDLVFTPAMIEFFFMAINILFSKENIHSDNGDHTRTNSSCLLLRFVF